MASAKPNDEVISGGRLGKLNFHLEALDRDVRKPAERRSVGALSGETKDNEVIKHALSRSDSRALVAQYQTRLLDKTLLQAEIQEFSALVQS